jgi:hypothetical protein
LCVAVAVVTAKVVEPDPVNDAGLNEAVTPEGRPVTLKFTVPAKLAPGVTVTVPFATAPGGTVSEEGVDESENAGNTETVRVFGFGSFKPTLSVTVREATYVPGEA